jgi:hypothetical protein
MQVLYQLSYASNCPLAGGETAEKHWWRGLDSNQRGLPPAVLQTAPFNHFGTPPKPLELAVGLEPTTCRLQGGCSAN